MPIQSPDPAAVARVSEHYGVGRSDAYLASFSPRVHGLLASWGRGGGAVPAVATTCSTSTTWRRSARARDELRIAVETEKFGRVKSALGVDDAVRAATETLRQADLGAKDVSATWHVRGAKLWDLIAAGGAITQTIEGEGDGRYWEGLPGPGVHRVLRQPVVSGRLGVLGDRPPGAARPASRDRDAGEDLARRRERPPRLQRAGALVNGLTTDMISTGGSTTPRCCASRMARASGRLVPDDGDRVDGTRRVTWRIASAGHPQTALSDPLEERNTP